MSKRFAELFVAPKPMMAKGEGGGGDGGDERRKSKEAMGVVGQETAAKPSPLSPHCRCAVRDGASTGCDRC